MHQSQVHTGGVRLSNLVMHGNPCSLVRKGAGAINKAAIASCSILCISEAFAHLRQRTSYNMEERRQEEIFDHEEEHQRTDTSHAPSEQTRSQDVRGRCACSAHTSTDIQYIESRITKCLDDSFKELFKTFINSIERRFSDLETSVSKIQEQLRSLQQQVSVQHLRHESGLISLQMAEDCCEDLEKQDDCSSESYANFHAYVRSMQKYQEKCGSRHMPLRSPSRVVRQRRITSRSSLTYPFLNDTTTL